MIAEASHRPFRADQHRGRPSLSHSQPARLAARVAAACCLLACSWVQCWCWCSCCRCCWPSVSPHTHPHVRTYIHTCTDAQMHARPSARPPRHGAMPCQQQLREILGGPAASGARGRCGCARVCVRVLRTMAGRAEAGGRFAAPETPAHGLRNLWPAASTTTDAKHRQAHAALEGNGCRK